MESNVAQGNSLFTVKRVLRVLALLLIVFVFCPSFLVSCSGQNVNVSVMTAVGGVSAYGEKVVDPHPIMLICLLLPIVMLVVLFAKKILDTTVAIISFVAAAIDFVIWLVFRSSVKKLAEDNYCDFKTTGIYVINIIVLILILLLTLMMIIKKLEMESDLIQIFTGGSTQKALDQMSSAVNQMSTAVSQMAGNVVSNIAEKNNKVSVIGYCQKCGSGIPYDCKFCTSCGTPVPEELILAAEEKKKAEEEAKKAAEEAENVAQEKVTETDITNNLKTDGNGEKAVFCQQCGAKLASDVAFCESCGAKVE